MVSASTMSDAALATTSQQAAEEIVLQLLDDPELRQLRRQLAAELRETATGRTRDGSLSLDAAIGLWSTSMIFSEVSAYQAEPAFIWATDNTPRSWFGHDLPGAGIAGDNPDFVYRRLTVDGDAEFEIMGRLDLAYRPVEMTMEAMRGNVGPMALKDQSRQHADMGNQIGVIKGRDLALEKDGSFRIKLGGRAAGPNHLPMEHGEVTILVRDVLGDWNQRPAALEIRRTGGAELIARSVDEMKRAVIAKLPTYVRFWSDFHTTWLGGLAPNAFAGPVPRDGGWGFIAGLRFDLAPDQGLLVRTIAGSAAYTGFQLTDPWMMTADARKHQASINISQARPDEDGGYTYVISAEDPGVANWLDTAGLHSGFALLRWQAMSGHTEGVSLLKDFRVINSVEATTLPGVPHTSKEERLAEITDRARLYAMRATVSPSLPT
jgi:hypothetical protein